MSRRETPTTSTSFLTLFLAFVSGIAIGLVLVQPVLPDITSQLSDITIPQGGEVILVGVLTLAILAILVWVFYRIYLTF